MSSAKRTLSLRIKLLSLPLLFLLGLVVQQAANLHIQGLLEENVVAPRFRETALDGHRELLKAAVQIETQTLALMLKDCPSREEQIAVIIRETDPVRFLGDQSGYFFTYDLEGTRINVPINKADNGRNLIDLKDADGVFLIRELIAVARAGGGFVTYRFEKAGAGIQPKLSYAALIPGTDFFVGCGVYIDDVEADLARLAEDLNAASARLLRWALILSALVLVFTVAAAIRVSETTTRSIRAVISDLDTGGAQISAAAAHISDSSQALARGASDQAAALEETGASLAEMSALATHNTRDATTASELARAARLSADQGTGELDAMSRAMAGIKESSDDVAKIIKTIDEIAFQTNILALNAAVEAARAGESGAGFAIVAEEVRALAQRSALAARETAGKIEGAIAKTAQGVDITRQVTTRLDEIAAKVRQVDDLVGKVASDSRSQSERVQQITAASGSVDRVVQANAASAEENAAAAEELTAQAHALGTAISHLRVLVSGRRRQPADSHAKVVTTD